VPDHVSDERAAFVEPLACVVRSLRRAGLKHGDTLAIIGVGVMGMLHLLLGQAWGAGQIYAIDRLAHRLAFAESLGATPLHADDAPHALRDGAAVVVVGPSSEPALALALQIVAPDGTVVLFTPAPPDVRFPLPWHDLYLPRDAPCAQLLCQPCRDAHGADAHRQRATCGAANYAPPAASERTRRLRATAPRRGAQGHRIASVKRTV
jgi:hypothetical protein